ncbi:hypothetical protein [Rhodopila sp.]|uniref:hypothetical protein n=1 Tax=Rhodopila sp. TaxID=2480087 RepID=UPI003D0ED7C4
MALATTTDQATTDQATTAQATTAQARAAQATTECVMQTILDFLLPFFLAAAGGNPVTARAAIRQLIAAHNAVDATELDLAGRIVGFSIAALDNLRLSMAADLPVTRLLRYRGNAVSLSRASDQARKALAALRANPDQPHKMPRPSVAPALSPPAPSTPVPSTPFSVAATCSAQSNAAPPRAIPSIKAIAAPPAPAPLASAQPTSAPPTSAPPASAPPPAALAASASSRATSALTNSRAANPAPLDIEAMKRDARMLMNAFSKQGASSAASIPAIADPATLAAAAARAAVAATRRPNLGSAQGA